MLLDRLLMWLQLLIVFKSVLYLLYNLLYILYMHAVFKGVCRTTYNNKIKWKRFMNWVLEVNKKNYYWMRWDYTQVAYGVFSIITLFAMNNSVYLV